MKDFTPLAAIASLGYTRANSMRDVISIVKPLLPAELIAWIAAHPVITAIVVGFCIWASATLILRIWILHRRERFRKKLFWSFVVLVPFFGWIFYGGLFHVPDFNDTPCSDSTGVATGGDGGLGT